MTKNIFVNNNYYESKEFYFVEVPEEKALEWAYILNYGDINRGSMHMSVESAADM